MNLTINESKSAKKEVSFQSLEEISVLEKPSNYRRLELLKREQMKRVMSLKYKKNDRKKNEFDGKALSNAEGKSLIDSPRVGFETKNYEIVEFDSVEGEIIANQEEKGNVEEIGNMTDFEERTCAHMIGQYNIGNYHKKISKEKIESFAAINSNLPVDSKIPNQKKTLSIDKKAGEDIEFDLESKFSEMVEEDMTSHQYKARLSKRERLNKLKTGVTIQISKAEESPRTTKPITNTQSNHYHSKTQNQIMDSPKADSKTESSNFDNLNSQIQTESQIRSKMSYSSKFIKMTKKIHLKMNFLINAYSNLVKEKGMKKVIQAVTQVIDINQLRKLEEISSQANFSEEKEHEIIDDFIVNLTSEEEEENQNQKKQYPRLTERLKEKDQAEGFAVDIHERTLNKNTSSVGQKNLFSNPQLIRRSVLSTVENIYSKSYETLKTIMILFFVAFSLFMRHQITAVVTEYEYYVTQLSEIEEILVPSGYYFKEMGKFELVQLGILDKSILKGIYQFSDYHYRQIKKKLQEPYKWIENDILSPLFLDEFRLLYKITGEEEVACEYNFENIHVRPIEVPESQERSHFRVESFVDDVLAYLARQFQVKEV